jgi:hypothetical protein
MPLALTDESAAEASTEPRRASDFYSAVAGNANREEHDVGALPRIVADASDVQALQNNNGNLIFIGVFFIVILLVVIWWLKRQV